MYWQFNVFILVLVEIMTESSPRDVTETQDRDLPEAIILPKTLSRLLPAVGSS